MKQLDPKSVWLFFFSVIIRWFLFYLVILFLFASYSNRLVVFIVTILGTYFSIILLIVLPVITAFIWAKLSYYYYRYELTESGFRKEYGVIYKRYVTIPYDRIQNVDILRGILARLLGLSDIHIQTAGVSGASSISYGAGAEGRLPGLSRQEAEQIRDELIARSRQSKNQGL